jgi:hypothetical protein
MAEGVEENRYSVAFPWMWKEWVVVRSFNGTDCLGLADITGNSPILRSSTYERSSANEGMKMLINESIQTVLPSDFA